MSTFDDYYTLPNTKKIVLVEIDIEQAQDFFANYRAGVYFVNFDVSYTDSSKMEIASGLLSGVSSVDIVFIGSVKSDGVSLSWVSSSGSVITTENSFYYNSIDNELFIHLNNGDPPQIHDVEIGNMYGLYMGNAEDAPDGEGVYQGLHYDERIISISSLQKSKDALFFGKIGYDSSTIIINNTDGEYDTWTIDNDVFGNEVRILLGFNDLAYSEFRRIFTGYVERVTIGPIDMKVVVQDRRKKLSRAIPNNVYSQSTYSDLRNEDIGKAIPWGYGQNYNSPVICTNYNEASAATYTFKIVDVNDHAYGIGTVQTAYIDGATTAIESSNNTNATFNIYGSAVTNINQLQKVSCDYQGYIDSSGVLIDNGLDVIQDILSIFYSYTDTSDFYNTSEWNTATNQAFDIGIHMSEVKGAIDWIEVISSSMLGDFIVEDAGTYTYRIYNATRYPSQTIKSDDLIDTPSYEDDPTEILTSAKIGYAKDIKNKEYRYYHDTSNESTNFSTFNAYLEKVFDTVLVNATDAQSFSTNIFTISGQVQRKFTIELTGYQTIKREIGDFIWVYVDRPVNEMLGRVKAEIIGITKNLDDSKITLNCRFIESDPELTEFPNAIYTDNVAWDTEYVYTDPGSSFDNDSYYNTPQEVDI